MATNKIEMQYDLVQNGNEDSTAFGKWYPRVVRTSTLDLQGLSDHIAAHGSIYTEDVVAGVLTKFSNCMVELLEQGIAVKIDGLGTFYPTLESKGAESPVLYNLDTYLQGVHIRFLPDDTDRAALSSRQFRKKVAMKQRMIFDNTGKPKKVVDGQLVDYGGGNGGN